MLAPIRELIVTQGWTDSTLLLCPSGALHLLPFAAAHWGIDSDGQPIPLIEAHPLLHLPTLALATEVQAREQPRPDQPRAYIAAADPWNKLHDIYTEADAAKAALDGKHYQVMAVQREGATIASLRAHSEQARVVHLAMHSGMHETRFEYCGAEFHDTRLTVLELLLRLRLMKTQLAIVATCSSNQPRELLADDPSVITRAWMLSGAASVIGGLWPLADGPAMEFSEAFYAEWGKEGCSLVKAVQQAILKVRQGYKDDLYAWAPFTLVGNGATLM